MDPKKSGTRIKCSLKRSVESVKEILCCDLFHNALEDKASLSHPLGEVTDSLCSKLGCFIAEISKFLMIRVMILKSPTIECLNLNKIATFKPKSLIRLHHDSIFRLPGSRQQNFFLHLFLNKT